jgi:hypothetical protein
MFDLKAKAAEMVLNELKNKIHEIKPAELIDFANKIFAAELDALKGDADHDGVQDLVEVEKDIAEGAAKFAHAASVIHAAHEAKK